MEIKDKIIWAAIVIGGNSFTWIARQYKPELWKAKTSHNHEWWNINWEGNNVQNDHPWLLRDAHKQLFINRWSGVPTFALVSSIMGMMAVGKCCNCRHGASMVPSFEKSLPAAWCGNIHGRFTGGILQLLIDHNLLWTATQTAKCFLASAWNQFNLAS